MSVPQLNMTQFDRLNRGLLENCGRIRSFQDELYTMVKDIAKNEEDYRKGRLPRNSFKSNLRKFTRERRRLEKEINSHIRQSLDLISETKKLAREQRV